MADVDLEGGKEKEYTDSGSAPKYDYGEAEPISGTKWSHFRDSFKRNPNARMVTVAVDEEGKPFPDQPPAEPALSMQLKNRHLQMIAIGGSIGVLLLMRSARQEVLTTSRRNWSLRRFRCRPRSRRSGLPRVGIWPHRDHVILHRPRTRRVGRRLSSCWFIRRLRVSLPRPSLGLRYGVELRTGMACCASS